MKIGFIGTGIMGRGMVRNLLRADHSVRVFNRTRAKAEEAAGRKGVVVDSVADAVEGAEVVCTMLADPPAVDAVYDEILPRAARGQIFVDSSTVSPATSVRLAEGFASKGASFLDAPVFGSRNEAETGTLLFLVGGDRAAFATVEELLSKVMGRTAIHLGGSGRGSTAKLVGNLIVALQYEALSEGLVLATKAGIDPRRMTDILMTVRTRCGILEMKGPPVLERDFTPFFALRLMDKDVGLALETARSLEVPMPGLGALRQVFTAGLAAGLGDEDFSALIKVHERNAGVEVRGR